MRRKNVRRFTVELSLEEYELLEYLTKELDVSKASVVRNALRRYFSELVMSLYAPEFKRFMDIIRLRFHEEFKEKS